MAPPSFRVEQSSSTSDDTQPSYHDDEENDADVSSPDAPLTGHHPTHGFDDYLPDAKPTWYHSASRRIPSRLKRAWRAVVRWTKGPNPPRIYTITPFLPKIQHAPIELVKRIAPKRTGKIWLSILLCAAWILSFSLVLWSSNAAVEVPGYGSPVVLSCTSVFWGTGNDCGINGDGCRPFSNSTMAFRCPANCASVQVLNPHAVGDQEVVYQSLTVGGPVGYQTGFEGVIQDNAVYRGDSFICPAAVHSGFISNSQGGCGVTTLTDQQPSFIASNANGIQSIGFDSYFPLSFGFGSGTQTECRDLRWRVLIVSVIFSTVLGIFTTSPELFFWGMFILQFFTVALATDPPFASTFYGRLSTAFGRFLPAAFCIGIMYRFFIKRSLKHMTAQIEKTVLWVGGAWVGALNNYTFSAIPIQRLTPHDLKQQPGAITALVFIVLIILAIALGQAWAFRIEGRMPRYLALYGVMGLSLLLLLALPGENLRIHHYILALLFIPGTSFQNRPSLLYQGLLVGLFVNGIARWDFDSIIQTPSSLFDGAQQGSLLPTVAVIASNLQNITFNLGPLPVYDAAAYTNYDGISVLVNDVERLRGFGGERDYLRTEDFSLVDGNYTWTWNRLHSTVAQNTSSTLFTEYFRFGYMSGSSTADYTMAGKWTGDGKWVRMQPGPSKRKRSTSTHDLVQT